MFTTLCEVRRDLGAALRAPYNLWLHFLKSPRCAIPLSV